MKALVMTGKKQLEIDDNYKKPEQFFDRSRDWNQAAEQAIDPECKISVQ